MKRRITAVVGSSLSLVLVGCGESNSSATSSSTGSTSASWLLDSEPESVSNVLAVKQSASQGDRVAIRGVIGGNMHPISEESHLFSLVDEGLHNNCLKEDDHCGTPWDYCCAKQEDVRANSATIQIVAGDGSPLTGGPSGISPLDTVVVTGLVAPRPNDQVLVVHADGVYIMPKD
ncbi:MAG: hypothetical protein AAFR76_03925 [Planctomycetota bacterium]